MNGSPQTGPFRIVVTGADGFVGRHLLRVLRERFPGIVLVAAFRPKEGVPPPAHCDETAAFDLLDPGGMDAFVGEAMPDALIHLAASASVADSFADPVLCWRANLSGTVALASAAMRLAPDSRFVLASSAEIYGLSFQSGKPLDESASMVPANPYAASKAACDLAIGEMSLRGLDSVRIRAFNHTGAGQSETFAVSFFAKQVALVEAGLVDPVIHVGALDRWRDFLDVRDVCDAYCAALSGDLVGGSAYNVASGVPRRMGDILEALVDRTSVVPEIVTDAGRLRPTDVMSVCGDASLARRELGWAPGVHWGDTLDAVLAHWRARVRGGQV